MSAVSVRVIVVGDEILRGDVADRNGARLAAAVEQRGGRVTRIVAVPDAPAEIRRELEAAGRAGEGALLSGGLGPTGDDRTAAALEEFLGAPLGESASEVPNSEGTAAGVAAVRGDGWLLALPGVTRELEAMLREAAGRWLDERLPGERPPSRRVRVADMRESKVAEAVAGLPELAPLEVGSYPHGGLVDLVLRDASVEGAAERLDRAVEAVRERLGEAVYEVGERGLAAVVLDRLREAGQTLAVAESCTGGLLGGAVTEVPGASDVFLGGVVAYANPVKRELLGVRAATLEAEGAVSVSTAREMAAGARARLGTTWGVAITGVAGPGGGTEEKPVGTVWFAVEGPASVAERRQLRGDRARIRDRSVKIALDLLRRALP